MEAIRAAEGSLVQRPAGFSFLQCGDGGTRLQVFPEFFGISPGLPFIEKPIIADGPLEPEDLLVHTYLPGSAPFGHLVQVDDDVVNDVSHVSVEGEVQ